MFPYPQMDTLVDTINHYFYLGYTEDFRILEDGIFCKKSNMSLSPKDFIVEKTFRFEGMSDPDDEAILYLISSETYQIKGLLVNGYGIYNDNISQAMVEKLMIKR